MFNGISEIFTRGAEGRPHDHLLLLLLLRRTISCAWPLCPILGLGFGVLGQTLRALPQRGFRCCVGFQIFVQGEQLGSLSSTRRAVLDQVCRHDFVGELRECHCGFGQRTLCLNRLNQFHTPQPLASSNVYSSMQLAPSHKQTVLLGGAEAWHFKGSGLRIRVVFTVSVPKVLGLWGALSDKAAH